VSRNILYKQHTITNPCSKPKKTNIWRHYTSKGTRGHSCKLKKVRCTRDILRYFFE